MIYDRKSSALFIAIAVIAAGGAAFILAIVGMILAVKYRRRKEG